MNTHLRFICFRFNALTELGAFMRSAFSLCISVLSVALFFVLFFCFVFLCVCFFFTRRFVLSLALYFFFFFFFCIFFFFFFCIFFFCIFFFVFFFFFFVLVFSILLALRAWGRANLSAFCMFVRFVLVWFYLFPLPLRVCCGTPGLFSYLFFSTFQLPSSLNLPSLTSSDSILTYWPEKLEYVVHLCCMYSLELPRCGRGDHLWSLNFSLVTFILIDFCWTFWHLLSVL